MRRHGKALGLKTTRPEPVGLISRVADSCLWFGRYLERAESTVRLLQAHRGLALDGELPAWQCWQPVIIVSGEEASYRARHAGADGLISDGESVETYLVWEPDCWVSLLRSVGAARENARAIREVVSGDVWETVNALHLFMQPGGDAEGLWRSERDRFYRRVRELTQLALGLMRSTMLHDTALDFIWLGVMLERTNQTARLLDVHHHAFDDEAEEGDGPRGRRVVETAVWLTLLRACSGLEPFLKTNAGRVSPEAVARFLVADARFPRSITYCVHAALERFCYLRPPADVDLPGGEALERLQALDAWISDLPDEDGDLHAILTRIVDETSGIAACIGHELLGYGDGQGG